MTLLEHQISTEHPHQRRPRWRLWAALAGVGGCLLSGAAGGAIVLAVHGTGSPAATTGHQPAPEAAGPGQAAAINATRLAAAIGPAVVNISTQLDALEGGGRAAGTGMIITRNGEIVTNNHVVQGADTVAVAIRGHGTHPAAVIGTDPAADIAVLRVRGLSGLPVVRFGDSARAAVGDQVLAIGNALGLGGSPTVSQGIISATGRAITATDQTGSNPERLHGLLQTDAPIAPGNSGGPLVGAAGTVIGMDTAAASAAAGGASLGFAIPANTIQAIAGQITAVAGHPTPTTTALSRQIAAHKPGQVVSVTVSTQHGTRTAQVRLGQGPIS